MKRLVCLITFVMMLAMSMTAYAKEFNPSFYAASYQDVAAAYGNDGAALFKHYTEHGKAEGRIPYNGATPGEEVTFSGDAGVAPATQTEESSRGLVAWMKKIVSEKHPNVHWTDEYCEKYGPIVEADLKKCPTYANAEIVRGRVSHKSFLMNDKGIYSARVLFDLSNGWTLKVSTYEKDDSNSDWDLWLGKFENRSDLTAYYGRYMTHEGRWFENYEEWLQEKGVGSDGIKVIKWASSYKGNRTMEVWL
ncbi:MAG: hypothetical protein E7300_03530 [Lachnospiraceae bacterium]|nr:hypothetical protein [Lachnospiraceae bacterium]